MTAVARTLTLRDGRVARLVDADDAGEVYLSVADGLVDRLEAAAELTWRQAEAARWLLRLHGLAGGRTAWARGSGGGREPCEDSHRELRQLEACVPAACRWTVTGLLAGGVTLAAMPGLRRALSVVADRLRLDANC